MKVSIIIPYVYDRGYLLEAVYSASKQKGFQLGIDYELLLEKADRTLGANINEAVKRAKGEYIKILPDDDLLDENCLSILYPFAKDRELDFVCADAVDFGNASFKPILKKSTIPNTVADLARENTIHGGTILYKRETMPSWDESYWTCEEWVQSIRMAQAGLRFGYVPGVVFHYRHHTEQKHFDWRKKDGVYRFEIKESIQAKYHKDTTLIDKYQ